METFIFKGKLELFDGKKRSFSFDSNNRSLDEWVVMEKALKAANIKEDKVLCLESWAVVTTYPTSIKSDLIDE